MSNFTSILKDKETKWFILDNGRISPVLGVAKGEGFNGAYNKAKLQTKRKDFGMYTLESLTLMLASAHDSMMLSLLPVKLDEIPANESGKRGLEVAIVQGHSVTLVAGRGLDDINHQFMSIAYRNGVIAQRSYGCPCGNGLDDQHYCSCSDMDVINYRNSLSPTEMYIQLNRPCEEIKQSNRRYEPHDTVMRRVGDAQRRIEGVSYVLDDTCSRLMNSAVKQMGLTDDCYNNVIEVARSITAIYGGNKIQPAFLAEALQYRPQGVLR